MRKKAQLAAHFHWIFILIAGAVILTFFVTIVVKQKDISDTKIATTAATGIDKLFTATGATENTVTRIETPDLEFEFFCDEFGYSAYNIKNAEIPDIPTSNEIIFASSELKGNPVYVWTLPWNMPFKVANFQMFFSPEINYVVVYDSMESLAYSIFEELPEQASKDITTTDDFDFDNDYYKTNIILVSDSDSFLEKLDIPRATDVSAIRVWNNGNSIQFYNEDLTASDTFALSRSFPDGSKNPLLYSAIFTQNSITYKCNLKKAIQRLNYLIQIYIEKTNELDDYYETSEPDSECSRLYDPGYLNQLKSSATSCLNNFDNCISSLANNAAEVESTNENYRNAVCSLLY